MNLLISDTQIKAKILPGDHAFSFCVSKLWNDSPEHIQCKMEFECSSKNNLKALKSSKRYFYFVVLFNNFSILPCYELLLLSSRLS